ncbi:hypothetical protein H7849_25240 [Alloacidobacterium dinghuense]|uniref:Glycosyltransferase RgtA/B/C/D-like domain-containing protein n=1 Tax=Alloacidobacterium dinghuense TaxID=2763107 RepID=A0A7G8BI80_9BACT|nr:hypothetical protein [Alloacidobacterium dinghuense]QNI32250.1 hypothetical protein H7849_25240 [Alloacidobacterium dinghuense]
MAPTDNSITPSQSSVWWLQYLLLLILYSGCFLFLASALKIQFGFPLDDSYIHQTVARNFARYDVLGFIPGKPSSGATSLIWACIQASNYKFLHFDPVKFNFVFSWIMLALIGPLLFTLSRRDGLPPLSSFVLAASPALCGNFIWLGLIGMEHLLFIMLVLVSIYFWFDLGPHRGRNAVFAGLGSGLLAITRPEAMVFGPLLALSSLKVKRTFSEITSALAVWAVFLVLLFGSNFYTSHSFMPATLKGRTWLYFHTSGGPHTVHSMIRFLGAWIQRLPRQFSTRYVQQIQSLHEVHGSFALYGFLLFILAAIGVYALVSKRLPRVSFLLSWAVLHSCIYLLTFPTGGHGGRYQPLNLLLLFPCLFFGALWLLQRVARGQTPWTSTVAVIALVVAGTASLRTWRIVTIDGIGHINGTHGKMGVWMLQNLPPDADVAAFDIGRISYTWNRRLLDLGGLVDPSYVPYLTSGRIPEYLEEHHVQYVVLPKKAADEFGFTHDPALTMTKLSEFCSPYDPWIIGFRYTIHAMECQELYQLHYNDSAEKQPVASNKQN